MSVWVYITRVAGGVSLVTAIIEFVARLDMQPSSRAVNSFDSDMLSEYISSLLIYTHLTQNQNPLLIN